MDFPTATRTLTPLVLAALLGGCAAPMTEAECRDTDWYKLGERDALVYGMQPQIDQYAMHCSRYGIRTADALYMRGWRDGYSEYSRRMGAGGGGGSGGGM